MTLVESATVKHHAWLAEWKGYIFDFRDREVRLLAREASLLLSLVKKPVAQVLHDIISHYAAMFLPLAG